MLSLKVVVAVAGDGVDGVLILMATLSDQTLHKCDVCDKAFNHKSTLTVHKRVHTGERPYVCSLCKKSFSKSGNLSAHMTTHSEETPYKCFICDKLFKRKSNLTDHLRVHSGERPYSCTFCEKVFSYSSTLANHMTIHSEKTPYRCSTCRKSFKRKDYLTKHLKVHTREHHHSRHISESSGCKQIPSRYVSHSSTSVDNKAKDEDLTTARSTLSEVIDPVLHSLETPYIINIKQEEQD